MLLHADQFSFRTLYSVTVGKDTINVKPSDVLGRVRGEGAHYPRCNGGERHVTHVRDLSFCLISVLDSNHHPHHSPLSEISFAEESLLLIDV